MAYLAGAQKAKDLDSIRKETKLGENTEAIRLRRKADSFTKAHLTVGLDNATPRYGRKPVGWPGTGSPTLPRR